jgi:hypothetical protein
MGRPPIGERAMTDAERKRRLRALAKERIAEPVRTDLASVLKARTASSRQTKLPDAAQAMARIAELEQRAKAGADEVADLKAQLAREQGRREAKAEPEIDAATLSMTAQQKLGIAIRQHQRRLDLALEQRVRERVISAVESIQLPYYREQWEKTRELLEQHRGYIARSEYLKIWRCLHPDSRNNATERLLSEAFNAFKRLEAVLVKREERTIADPNLPSTYEELMAMKRKVVAERKAKRAERAANSVVSR